MWEMLKTLKIPTLAVMVAFLGFGVELLKQPSAVAWTVQGIVGGGLTLVGALIGVFAYADYRAREGVNHVLEADRSAIATLEQALRSVSQTHSAIEKRNQDVVTTEARTDFDIGRGAYEPDAPSGTSVK